MSLFWNVLERSPAVIEAKTALLTADRYEGSAEGGVISLKVSVL